MKKSEVMIGKLYTAQVSGRIVPVKITGVSPYGGYNAVNEATGRKIRVRSAARLRGPANPVTVCHSTTGGN